MLRKNHLVYSFFVPSIVTFLFALSIVFIFPEIKKSGDDENVKVILKKINSFKAYNISNEDRFFLDELGKTLQSGHDLLAFVFNLKQKLVIGLIFVSVVQFIFVVISVKNPPPD